MREERHEDLRWSTQNTKLASALLLLGFQLAPKQPFTTLISGPKARAVIIWFFPYITQDNKGQKLEKPLLTRSIEALWQENVPDKMPWLWWMRRALEARDYLIKDVIHGGQLPMSGVSIRGTMWHTDNVIDASVAYSCGAKLHGYRDRLFYFEPKAEYIVAMSRRDEGEHRERWAKLVILQQRTLIGVISGRADESTTARVFGPFGTAFIPKLMTPPDKEVYLRKIDIGK